MEPGYHKNDHQSARSSNLNFGSHIKDVCLAGGTHGNELTGVYVVRHIKEHLESYHNLTFRLHLLHSNPRAIKVCHRYIDTDLNRVFSPKYLQICDDQKQEDQDHENPSNTPYEVLRARQIYHQFRDCDLLIDMHNTTADMGSTLILKNPDDIFILQLISCIQKAFTDRTIHPLLIQGKLENGQEISTDLSSIAKHGIGIELGPQPHGTLNAELYFHGLNLVKSILEFCTDVNSSVIFEETKIMVYEVYDKLDFPRSKDDSIEAMIHPSVQNWKLLSPNDPLFITFDGKSYKL